MGTVLKSVLLGGLAALALGTTGCRGQGSEEPPIVLIRNMFQQPKYDVQKASAYFADGRAMRDPVEGTVAKGHFEEEPEMESGRLADGTGYVLSTPITAARRAGGPEALVARGRERFDIYCSPCHDKSGGGNGTVVQRGFQKPPAFSDKRLRAMPDGQIFATISHGVRNMPAYGAQVPVQDRWAIVSYVRALQLAQVSMNDPAAPKTQEPTK